MEQPVVVSFPTLRPAQRRRLAAAPSSEVAEIRAMFREINRQYLAHQPSPVYLAVKRAMDVLISAFFIVAVLSWVLPIVALLVKLTSRGPLFFIQKRTGLHGAEFDCFKFRTMRVNDEAHIRQACANDTRITPVGRILRASHLDELPQLLNVFLGDMSLVGPRPHMLYHTRFYGQKIPFYNLRHEAKPGMTGMAQIKGYIGEITVERELRKRIQWDVYYLKNRGFGLDLHIVLATGLQVLGKVFPFLKQQKD